MAQSFHKRRILEGLMIQQWQLSLNKHIRLHGETVPIRNYQTVINYVSSGRLFHPEDHICRNAWYFTFLNHC